MRVWGFGPVSVFESCWDAFHLSKLDHWNLCFWSIDRSIRDGQEEVFNVSPSVHTWLCWSRLGAKHCGSALTRFVLCLFWFQSMWPLTPVTARAAAVSLPASLTNNRCSVCSEPIGWLLHDVTLAANEPALRTARLSSESSMRGSRAKATIL